MLPDVAALIRQVESLSQANATLNRILGAIDEYVYSGEFLPDGSYVLRYAGPCRERFLGLPSEQARTAVWVDHVHPDDVAVFFSSHEEALAHGTLDIQYRLLGADGRLRWVRDRGRIRHLDGQVYLDGSVLDVTALRQAEQRLTDHVKDIEQLAVAHREMAMTADPHAARRVVCRAVRDLCGATEVALFRPHGPDLVLVHRDGTSHEHLALPITGSSGPAVAYRSGERTFTADPAPVGHPGHGQAQVSRLFEPVLRAGRGLGVLAVSWQDRLEGLPDRVQALLPLLLTEVAVTLERADLLERLSVAAHTDALTGLPNRRALEDVLPLELGRAARSGLPLCLAMLDVDHFKAYNDRHGHPAGDLLLREAGQRWTSILRSSDVLVRFGGEEFLAVLPECDLPDAQELLERLRRATPGGQSCSIGVARWDGIEPADALLLRADRTMYAAKHAGRDRVLLAS